MNEYICCEIKITTDMLIVLSYIDLRWYHVSNIDWLQLNQLF